MEGVIATAVFVGALGYVIFRLEWRYMRSITPGAAMRRLRRSKEQRFSAEIRGVGWAWDPARTPRGAGFKRVYGRSRATYTMNDGGLIHLTIVRPDRPVHESEGPVPARYLPGTTEAARARRIRRNMAVACTLYPLGGMLGFVIGYNAGSGLSRGAMARHGLLGFFIGCLAIGVVFHMYLLVIGASRVGLGADKRSRDELR